MRLGLMFLCVSACQSFVTKSLVVVSHPLTPSFSKSSASLSKGWRKASVTLSFLGSTAQKAKSGSSVRLNAETLAAAENTKSLVDPPRKTEILADAKDFIKPDRDLHEYRHIKLHNNLQVLLVSTASASDEEEKSAKVEAASVHVQAGHFDDTIPGLAHFNEHMLVCIFDSLLLYSLSDFT